MDTICNPVKDEINPSSTCFSSPYFMQGYANYAVNSLMDQNTGYGESISNAIYDPYRTEQACKPEPIYQGFPNTTEYLPSQLLGDFSGCESSSSNFKKSPVKSQKSPRKVSTPRKRLNRFDGTSEEDVAKKFLPDHIDHDLDILIIGINPGLMAAHIGHHYAGPGNHFWKCLFMSGLTTEQCTAYDDFRMMDQGIGFTNIVARTTRGSADLSKKEIADGAKILLTKLQYYKPKIAVFNGKGIYEIFSKKKDFSFGKQPDMIEGSNTHVWVMPSSSARCSQLPRAADKVPFYAALKKFRDYLIGNNPDVTEEELIFKDLKLSNYTKSPKKESSSMPKTPKKEPSTLKTPKKEPAKLKTPKKEPAFENSF